MCVRPAEDKIARAWILSPRRKCWRTKWWIFGRIVFISAIYRYSRPGPPRFRWRGSFSKYNRRKRPDDRTADVPRSETLYDYFRQPNCILDTRKWGLNTFLCVYAWDSSKCGENKKITKNAKKSKPKNRTMRRRRWTTSSGRETGWHLSQKSVYSVGQTQTH